VLTTKRKTQKVSCNVSAKRSTKLKMNRSRDSQLGSSWNWSLWL